MGDEDKELKLVRSNLLWLCHVYHMNDLYDLRRIGAWVSMG